MLNAVEVLKFAEWNISPSELKAMSVKEATVIRMVIARYEELGMNARGL